MLNKLESVIKFFPLIFIILTTIGYIHLQVYYYYFDIEILNYLDLTEIILLFFDKSLLLTLGILFTVFISYILDYKIKKETDNKTEDSSAKSKKKPLRYFEISLIILQLAYIALSIIQENYIGLLYPIGFIICTIIYFLLEKYVFEMLFKNHGTFFFLSFVAGFVALLLINLSTITYSIEKGYNLRYKNITLKQISFSYNNKIISTSNKIKYIGETKSSLFLYDFNKRETIIYKMENVDYLRFVIN